MATCKVFESRVSLTLSVTLGEQEALALIALSAYGTDAFLKTFYEKMGESCLKPHELGLRSLFDLTGDISVHLARADKAREAFNPKPAVTQ